MGGLIDAVVFDFDGLILDTETPIVESWAEAFGECGLAPLTIADWATAVGTAGGLDPLAELRRRAEGVVGDDLLDEVLVRRRTRRDILLAAEAVRPGVEAWLAAADRHGLGLAVASSSPRPWVEGHLSRLGLLDRFAALACLGDRTPAAADGAAAAVLPAAAATFVPHDGGGGLATGGLAPKPAPDVYLAACTSLGVLPPRALAVEDSPNGIAAAKAAGMKCLAVPNAVTRLLDLAGADLIVASLADMTLGHAVAAMAGP
jgi:beta-phosphoglucomutase-like phosphatase (HAD superfamily)